MWDFEWNVQGCSVHYFYCDAGNTVSKKGVLTFWMFVVGVVSVGNSFLKYYIENIPNGNGVQKLKENKRTKRILSLALKLVASTFDLSLPLM